MPKELVNNRFPIEISSESGEKMRVGVSEVEIETTLTERSVFMKILNFISSIMLIPWIFVIIYIPCQVYRVFYSTIKKDIFDPLNYRIFNKIGFAFLYIYLVMLARNIVYYVDAKNNISLQDYNIYFDLLKDIYVLFIGLISLFFAETLKVATTMKEEQELTI